MDAVRAAALKGEQKEAAARKRRIRQLRKLIENSPRRHEIRLFRDYTDELRALEEAQCQWDAGQIVDEIDQKLGRICEEVGDAALQQVEAKRDLLEVAPSPFGALVDECDLCGATLEKLSIEALLACPDCGTSTPYLDTTPISQSTDAKSDASLFSYKRSNHFTEWINAAQGLENTQIPAEILDSICAHIEKHHIPDARITAKKIRAILKALGARKYYEHSVLIWSKVTGKTPKRFTARQEETLKNMFASIQEPFERHCPPDRKNFLSYSYVLFKMCEILALDEFLPQFQLLKGREKLHRQDLIFRKIWYVQHGRRRRRRAPPRSAALFFSSAAPLTPRPRLPPARRHGRPSPARTWTGSSSRAASKDFARPTKKKRKRGPMSYSLVSDAWGPSWQDDARPDEPRPQGPEDPERGPAPRVALYEATPLRPLLASPFPWLVLLGTLMLGLLINVNIKVGTLCRRLELVHQLGPSRGWPY